MDAAQFLTHSLRASSQGAGVSRLLAAALNAVDPVQAVRQHLRREGDWVLAGGRSYNLKDFRRVIVIGFGKASLPMAGAVAQILGESITQGILITKSIPSQFPIHNSQFEILRGAHPIPDQTSIESARRILDLLSTTSRHDLVIFLISGGGSALLTSPVPGIALADLQTMTQALLDCGATINEINCLRKHISQIKGGQLARSGAPAQILTLILSDVIGDPLDVIASGPTVPDPTTFADALGIVEKRNLRAKIPPAILNRLQKGAEGDFLETPKPGDPIFERVYNHIIGSNRQAAQAALGQARQEGFNPFLLTTSLQGEARDAGQMLAGFARKIIQDNDPISRPACLLAGGETTVTLLSPSGRGSRDKREKGGRNQELALASVFELAGLDDVILVALATDGEDGPTDAAGAVVTGETLERARHSGLDPSEALSRHASYRFFDALDDLIKIGPTHTNVNDLAFLFVF